MSAFDPWEPFYDSVQRQQVFLRNPLPPGTGVCRVCRSSAGVGFATCFQCAQHAKASRTLADAVVPVSYALKGQQHAHNLAAYKFTPPSQSAQRALLSLGLVFLRTHIACLSARAGGDFTHLSVVPSTKGRIGAHPIDGLLQSVSLPRVQAVAITPYPPDDRAFHHDRFSVDAVPPRSRVLLVDDTWTTGARIQSLSHALKAAGASSVVAVVLGRHVNPNHDGSQALVDQIVSTSFDINRCSLDD